MNKRCACNYRVLCRVWLWSSEGQREQGWSSLIFPRQPKKKKNCLKKQNRQTCLDIWRSQSRGQHCVVTFGFGEAKKWFTDPRKLRGAGMEATIEDDLKAGASLICRLNSLGSLAAFGKETRHLTCETLTFRVLWRGFIFLKPWKRGKALHGSRGKTRGMNWSQHAGWDAELSGQFKATLRCSRGGKKELNNYI